MMGGAASSTMYRMLPYDEPSALPQRSATIVQQRAERPPPISPISLSRCPIACARMAPSWPGLVTGDHWPPSRCSPENCVSLIDMSDSGLRRSI